MTGSLEDKDLAKISIVVPCYNEDEVIDYFYEAMLKLDDALEDEELEVIFIDDGSKDGTYRHLCRLHEQDARMKYISFSRNFGKEAAIFSGLRAAEGDCCVVMDADLQHPPELIPEMYRLWKQGYEVVEGIKSSRGKESALHSWFAGIFYRLISRFIGIDMRNSSDFKLMDRKVVDALSSLTEKNTFFRALAYWVGFKSTEITYNVRERVAGKSKWSFHSLWKYAVQNLLSFTNVPLKLVTVMGVVFLIIGAAMGIDAVYSFFHGRAVGGYPSLVLLIFVATGGIFISLGIIGEYIAKIYDEIKNRPPYIIRDKSD